MTTTTTPAKLAVAVAVGEESKFFEDALKKSCIRRRVLACTIAQLRHDHPDLVALPSRAQVLLAEHYHHRTTTANTVEAEAHLPENKNESTFSKYVTTPAKLVLNSPPLKLVGKALSFVVNGVVSGELGAIALPSTDFADDDEDDHKQAEGTELEDTAKNEEERLQDSDVVVAQSMLITATATLQHVLELIDPAILSASELRATLLAKLEEMQFMDQENRLWLKDLTGEHWSWLIREMGLEVVVPPMAAGAPPLYMLGTIVGHTQETRLTLYKIDQNIASVGQKIESYETHMQIALGEAKRPTAARHSKL
jgi:hypothetical protein